MSSEIGQRPTEAGHDLLTCRHCGQPAVLEECWDLQSAVVLMVHCQHCGIAVWRPGSTIVQPQGEFLARVAVTVKK